MNRKTRKQQDAIDAARRKFILLMRLSIEKGTAKDIATDLIAAAENLWELTRSAHEAQGRTVEHSLQTVDHDATRGCACTMCIQILGDRLEGEKNPRHRNRLARLLLTKRVAAGEASPTILSEP
jgi:hypothetical protein